MKQPVILFDGVCNFCNASVQFIIKRDPKAKFKFAPLQSDFGKKLLEKHGMSSTQFDTLILFKNDRLYTRSTAALLVAKELNGLWPLMYVFRLVPWFIRDIIYNFISKNRYRWFGKKDSCMIPSKEMRERFEIIDVRH